MDTPPSPRRRRITLALILMLFLCAGAAAGLWYLRTGQWVETTEDAYLSGNLVTVSAEVEGTVVAIGAEENERVTAGAELVQLAEGDALQILDTRKQELRLALQEIEARRVQVQRARAELRLREITLRLAREEHERRQRLAAKRMLADEELDAARTRAEETAGEFETARHVLAESEVRAGAGPIESHPVVTAAASALRAAWRAWHKTRVLAPVAGQIARRRVQLGQRIAPGTPLFSIAESGSVWIEANFKENQLRHLRPGQPVRIRSDLYGDELTLSGRVASIGAGTGAVFAVLPPQNATGNWIKIVQRVPVRIELDAAPGAETPLPFGASLHIEVNTHERSGSRITPVSRSATLSTSPVYDRQDEGADALIEAVIAAHRAGTPTP